MRIDWKTAAGVLLYIALGISGDLILKSGMAQMPPLTGPGLNQIARFFRHIFTTPEVGLGVALLAANFSMLLVVLSWADLSVVGPARAISYLFLALMAHFFLRETVPPLRWAGVLLIALGVGMILTSGESEEEARGKG